MTIYMYDPAIDDYCQTVWIEETLADELTDGFYSNFIYFFMED